MKKLFQILFFVLYPLIIYSQDNLHNENDSTRRPHKLGAGLVLGFGGGSIINNDVINNIYNNNAFWGVKSELYRPYSFPYLQFTRATSKFHFHNVGMGYKNTVVDKDISVNLESYYTQKIKSFRIYYQYDFPLFKTKSSSALLYTGINCSATIQEFEFKKTLIYYEASCKRSYSEIFKSYSYMISLNLPVGYRKRFGSSRVWFDCGINLKLISYEHINYNDEKELKITGPTLPPFCVEPFFTSENGKKDKFYPISFSPYLMRLNGFYFKIIFM